MASVKQFNLAMDDEKVGSFYSMHFRGTTKTWGKYQGYQIVVTFNEDMDQFSDTDILDLQVPQETKETWLSQVSKQMFARLHLIHITDDEDPNDNDDGKIGVLEVMEKNEFSTALENDGWIGSYYKIDLDHTKREVRIDVIKVCGNEVKESPCSIYIEIDGEILNSEKFKEIIDENRELRVCERSLYQQNQILVENEIRLLQENRKLKRLTEQLAEELAFIYES